MQTKALKRQSSRELLTALICWLFFFIIFAFIPHIRPIDEFLHILAKKTQNPASTFFMLHITNIISREWLIMIAGVAATLLIYSKKHELLIRFNILLLISILMTKIAQSALKRERPVDAFLLIDGYGFPSLHAVLATVLALFFFLLVDVFIEKKALRAVFKALLALVWLMVCISRIYLNVHWASDVVAGIFFGVSLFYLSKYIALKFKLLQHSP